SFVVCMHLVRLPPEAFRSSNLKASSSELFFLNEPPPTEIYPLPLHDALPIYAREHIAGAGRGKPGTGRRIDRRPAVRRGDRSEEHTSELQSHLNLVCRLL